MMCRVLLCLCATFLVISPCQGEHSSRNQDRRIDSQAPLQAELLAAVDVGKLSLGASVFAKTRVEWNQPACHLRIGSMVVGHVIDIEKRSKQSSGSTLTIAFDHADCDGHLASFQFTLIALVAAPTIDEGAPLRDSSTRLMSASMAPHIGGGGAKNSPPPPLPARDDMSVSGKFVNDKTPSVIFPGQVIGLKKVALSVGTGADGASVLSSLKDNIRLEGATQLVLMPRRIATPATETAAAASASTETASVSIPAAPPPSSTPPPPPPPEIDETSICTAPCTLISEATGNVSANASLSVPTALFGFVPHDNKEFSAFDYQSTLTYLDSQNLLFTYDPHKLRQRLPSGIRTESIRTIRAVLLDPTTLKVKKIVDWQVQGEGQFLWRAASGQILVHLGHHLRLLGPDLTVLREIAVPGQLAFVSTSPSGEYLAVGTLHERHTPTMHEQLALDLHIEPEEDIDVQLFNHDFALLLTVRQSSSQPPPVLSSEGEIRINAIGRNRWRIRELRWDHTDHTIADITSNCRPNLATPMPGSVFLVGCSESPLQNWYRLIRLDGHPILNGHGSSDEIEQSSSSTYLDDLAVRIVRTHSSKARGERFRKEDLKEQEVSVYRTIDGKRIFFVLGPNVSLAEQSFALSPDGAQLAILSGINLSLYPITKSN